jgi:5-methylcytosine-specific restriction endonuclease McrA
MGLLYHYLRYTVYVKQRGKYTPMDRFPKKACKYCGNRGHFPYACYKNPKNQAGRPKLKKAGKYAKQWIVTRNTWIRKNPPPIDGKYWLCYLRISPLCPGQIDASMLTLDHVVSRSRDPSKRFSMDNLQPCCWHCNTLKGSKDLEEVRPPVYTDVHSVKTNAGRQK